MLMTDITKERCACACRVCLGYYWGGVYRLGESFHHASGRIGAHHDAKCSGVREVEGSTHFSVSLLEIFFCGASYRIET